MLKYCGKFTGIDAQINKLQELKIVVGLSMNMSKMSMNRGSYCHNCQWVPCGVVMISPRSCIR